MGVVTLEVHVNFGSPSGGYSSSGVGFMVDSEWGKSHKRSCGIETLRGGNLWCRVRIPREGRTHNEGSPSDEVCIAIPSGGIPSAGGTDFRVKKKDAHTSM